MSDPKLGAGLTMGPPELSDLGNWHSQVELLPDPAAERVQPHRGGLLFRQVEQLHRAGEDAIERARHYEVPGIERERLWKATGHATSAWHALIRGQDELAREHLARGKAILAEPRSI